MVTEIYRCVHTRWCHSKESTCTAGDVRDRVQSGRGRSPGAVNGNPLQYSCLENSMDREALWVTVHGCHRVGHNWVWVCIHGLKYPTKLANWNKEAIRILIGRTAARYTHQNSRVLLVTSAAQTWCTGAVFRGWWHMPLCRAPVLRRVLQLGVNTGTPNPQATDQCQCMACEEPGHTAGGEQRATKASSVFTDAPHHLHRHLSFTSCQPSSSGSFSQNHKPSCELHMWGNLGYILLLRI